LTSLNKLVPDFRVDKLTLGTFAEWKDIALANNRDLAAARLAVETARLEISRQRADHAPRPDSVASYSKGDSETLNTYTQDTVTRRISVQLNVPIYSGGAVNAVTARRWSATSAQRPTSKSPFNYRLVYVVDGRRIVGYDNERGKGDHKHLGDRE
jgi:hypothetical protein